MEQMKGNIYKLDFTKAKSIEELALILNTLDIQITILEKLEDSKYKAIAKYLEFYMKLT